MPSARFPIPQGTLDMLILQILSLEPAHGYGIAQRLGQISRSVVQVNQGSLYPALHRLEQEARRQARLELGGVTQVREEVREIWLARWLRDFLYDLRFSARSCLRSPSFSAAATLSLALGIGATTAIYSLVDQVILHALPVREPERLVLIDWKGDQAASGFGSYNLMSYPIYRDLQRQGRVFDRGFFPAATILNL